MSLATQESLDRMDSLLHNMSLMLLLLPLNVILAAEHSDLCPCASAMPSGDVSVLEEHLSLTSTRTSQLNCCARHLLTTHDPQYHHNDSFILSWSFKDPNGMETNWQNWTRGVTTFETSYCGNQTLESDGVRLKDKGVYSCFVTSSSGTSLIKTFTLCINVNEDIGSIPLNASMSEDTYALLRDTVTFNCSAYVGEARCENKGKYNLIWTKQRPNGSWMEVSELSHTDVITSRVEKGMMRSRLTIQSVESDHFGDYRCIVSNHIGNLTLNITLTKGVTPLIRISGGYRAALIIIVAATVLLGTGVLLWRRCQVAFALHFRQKKTAVSSEDHEYDVFIIHAESASLWVWSVLLPALEDSFGYTCFLPQRDMCAGSMIIEEVAEAVSWCRCVVVVLSPCLLEDPWAAWSLHNAIKDALQARTRLVALQLQDIDTTNGFPDTAGILRALKHVRKIPVPRSCGLEDFQHRKDSLSKSSSNEETPVFHGNKSAKTLKVSTNVCRSRSKSPRNQKHYNMITVGNITLKGTKGTIKDKEADTFNSHVVFLERQDSDDLNSPSFETPFIFSSTETVRKDTTGARLSLKHPSVSTFLRVLCTADEKEVFWHTLLSWLGHPNTIKSQRQKHTSTVITA